MAKESARSLARQRMGAVMLRTTNPQHSLWEAILPSELLGLPAELARVDHLLDDPAFWEPFQAHFDPIIGRPSIPIETYLRMRFLKFRYRLGHELLCREVADSISWQRFCRIPLGGQVPHPTTLVKLTRRVGPAVVEQLNQALLAKAANHKVLPTHKVRLDTTVVEANVRYPTDAGLLAKAVSTLANTIGRVQATGGATRTTTRDRRRAARRRAHQLARWLRARSEQAKRQVTERTAELAGLAEQAAADAARVARNARRQLAHAGSSAPGKLARLVSELETTIGRTQQVLGQARTRLAGQTPDGASRLVSLHDPDARPIVKGWASRWSSATRPRWPTTPTGSCWTTWWRSATRPRRRCWCPRWSGSCSRPAGCLGGDRRPRRRRGRRRGRVARAGRGAGGDPSPGHAQQDPPSPRARPQLPAAGQVAHRL
jgi:transposase, IS5 family